MKRILITSGVALGASMIITGCTVSNASQYSGTPTSNNDISKGLIIAVNKLIEKDKKNDVIINDLISANIMLRKKLDNLSIQINGGNISKHNSSPTNASIAGTYKITAAFLNVRSEPTYKSNRLTMIRKGTTVKVDYIENNMAYLPEYNGFVSIKFIEKVSGSSSSSSGLNYETQIGQTSVDSNSRIADLENQVKNLVAILKRK